MNDVKAVVRNNVEKVRAALERIDAEALAYETGFMQRASRKLSIKNLVLALLALSPGRAPTLEKAAAIIR